MITFLFKHKWYDPRILLKIQRYIFERDSAFKYIVTFNDPVLNRKYIDVGCKLNLDMLSQQTANEVCFSPDGSLIGLAGHADAGRIFDSMTNQCLFFFYSTHNHWLSHICISANNQYVGCSNGETAYVYDICIERVLKSKYSTIRKTYVIQPVAHFITARSIRWMQWSKDSKYLFVHDASNKTYIYNRLTKAIIHTIDSRACDIVDDCYALLTNDMKVILYKIDDLDSPKSAGQLVQDLGSIHNLPVDPQYSFYRIYFSPDKTYMAFHFIGNVIVYNLKEKTGWNITLHEQDDLEGNKCIFHSKNKWLIIVCCHTVNKVDLKTKHISSEFYSIGPVCLAVKADDSTAVVASGSNYVTKIENIFRPS